MEKLIQQIAKARRRLMAQHFFKVLPWCWVGAFLTAVVAVALQKIFLPALDSWRWDMQWLIGGLLCGLLAAVVWVAVGRKTDLEVAMEIDRRFVLKERVSSALELAPPEAETSGGRALVEDAIRQIERLQIAQRFPVTVSRQILLPILPAVLAIILCALPVPAISTPTKADANNIAVQEQCAEQLTTLQKKVEAESQKARQSNLAAAAELFKKIAEQLQGLTAKTPADRHETLATLHDLSKELQNRQQQLSNSDALKEALSSAKAIPPGPAEKLTKELKEGDLQAAAKVIESLQNQLASGQLNDQQRNEFANQLAAMKNALEHYVDSNREAIKELHKQIANAKAAGDLKKATDLAQNLDNAESKNISIEGNKTLADRLERAAAAMRSNNAQQTSAGLKQLRDELLQMEQQAQEFSLLATTLNDIDGARTAMSTQQAGTADSMASSNPAGGTQGIGHLQGSEGDRPNSLKARFHDSPVPLPAGTGTEVVAGLADGPNSKGSVLEQIKSEMQAAQSEGANPMTTEPLPRAQREEVQQYFEAFRKGE